MPCKRMSDVWEGGFLPGGASFRCYLPTFRCSGAQKSPQKGLGDRIGHFAVHFSMGKGPKSCFCGGDIAKIGIFGLRSLQNRAFGGFLDPRLGLGRVRIELETMGENVDRRCGVGTAVVVTSSFGLLPGHLTPCSETSRCTRSSRCQPGWRDVTQGGL